MKISSVEAIPVSIPYRRPFVFASGEVATADHVIVRITTNEGIVGHAEAPPRPYTYGETQASIVTIIRDHFGPAIVGADPFGREGIHAALARTVGNNAARGAIDVALWDVVGQATGQPCQALLGGAATGMRVAHMVGFASTPEMVDEAVRMRERHGITAFKVKVGRYPVERDLQMCRAIREALGADVEIYVDANRGWDADTAIRAGRVLVEIDVTLFEEPCPADDVLGRRRVVRESPIPIVGDESCVRLGEVARNLLDGSCNAVSVKAARTGFTESSKIIGLCEGLGVTALVGNQVDGMLGTLASVSLGSAFRSVAARPGELSNFLLMADDVLADPPRIHDGVLEAPELPGIGARIDPEKLARYRADR
ncbi:MAG: enolase [Pseudonocardia sp.]|nr:enolase [Pseudonocardia sp.]